MLMSARAERRGGLMWGGRWEGFVPGRTRRSRKIRSYATAFGRVSSQGRNKVEPLLARIAADDDLPTLAKELLPDLGDGSSLPQTRQQYIGNTRILSPRNAVHRLWLQQKPGHRLSTPALPAPDASYTYGCSTIGRRCRSRGMAR